MRVRAGERRAERYPSRASRVGDAHPSLRGCLCHPSTAWRSRSWRLRAMGLNRSAFRLRLFCRTARARKPRREVAIRCSSGSVRRAPRRTLGRDVADTDDRGTRAPTSSAVVECLVATTAVSYAARSGPRLGSARLFFAREGERERREDSFPFANGCRWEFRTNREFNSSVDPRFSRFHRKPRMTVCGNFSRLRLFAHTIPIIGISGIASDTSHDSSFRDTRRSPGRFVDTRRDSLSAPKRRSFFRVSPTIPRGLAGRAGRRGGDAGAFRRRDMTF